MAGGALRRRRWIVGLLVLGTSGSLGRDLPAAAPLKTQTVKSTVDPHGKPANFPLPRISACRK